MLSINDRKILFDFYVLFATSYCRYMIKIDSFCFDNTSFLFKIILKISISVNISKSPKICVVNV